MIGGGKGAGKRYGRAEIDQAVQAVVDGNKPSYIAALCGTTVTTLYQWLKKAGYVPRKATVWVRANEP